MRAVFLCRKYIELEFDNALNSGATFINAIENRDWGDKVYYFADLDGPLLHLQSVRIKNNL